MRNSVIYWKIEKEWSLFYRFFNLRFYENVELTTRNPYHFEESRLFLSLRDTQVIPISHISFERQVQRGQRDSSEQDTHWSRQPTFLGHHEPALWNREAQNSCSQPERLHSKRKSNLSNTTVQAVGKGQVRVVGVIMPRKASRFCFAMSLK